MLRARGSLENAIPPDRDDFSTHERPSGSSDSPIDEPAAELIQLLVSGLALCAMALIVGIAGGALVFASLLAALGVSLLAGIRLQLIKDAETGTIRPSNRATQSVLGRRTS